MNRVKIMRPAKEFSNNCKCISGITVSLCRLTCPITPKLPGQGGVCAVSFNRMKSTHSVKTKEHSLRKNSCYSTSHNMQLSSWVTNLVYIATSPCWVTPLASQPAWLCRILFHLASSGSCIHPCCPQAAPRVITKVLAGHCMMDIAEAVGILHGGSPSH